MMIFFAQYGFPDDVMHAETRKRGLTCKIINKHFPRHEEQYYSSTD